jgi:hypothetical protein
MGKELQDENCTKFAVPKRRACTVHGQDKKRNLGLHCTIANSPAVDTTNEAKSKSKSP